MLNFPPECQIPPNKMQILEIRLFFNLLDQTNKTRPAPLFV